MLIVQTTRRQGVSYLEDTLATVGDVGSRDKLIVSDGLLPKGFRRPDGWRTVELPWQGARLTGWECMRIALMRGVKNLLLFQDDIVVCDGGGRVADECPVPDNAVAVTFFSANTLPGLQPKALGDPRLILIGASGTAQALKLPYRSLEHLCSRDPKKAPNHIQDEPHLFDDTLFAFARQSQWPHVAHLVPNIVRHVGEISACGTKRGFQQPWSVKRGERFPADVCDLPRFEVTYVHPPAPYIP